MRKPEAARTEKYNQWLPKSKKRFQFKCNEEQVKAMIALREEGKTLGEIAEMFGLGSHTSVLRYTDPEVRKQDIARSRKWREEKFVPGKRKFSKAQKARQKIIRYEYKQTERGFFIRLYNDKLGSIKKRDKLIKYHENVPVITFDELMTIWNLHLNKYGMNCFYTGLPLTFYNPNKPMAKTLISIDRFDSDLGYTKENIVFCCWSFNERKNAVDIKMAKLIIKKNKEWLAILKTNPIKINSMSLKEEKKLREKMREQDPIKYKKLATLFNGTRTKNKRWFKEKDKRYNPDLFSFSGLVSFIEGYIERYGLNCFYTGEPINFKLGSQEKKNRNAISIDRIESNKGYTLDNIVICSFGFNWDKRSILIQDCYIIIKKEEERLLNFEEGKRGMYSEGGIVR